MNKKKRSFLLIGFVLLAVLLAAAVASAKSPAATADIPKINYVEGLILTQEAMEVDPARAQRGLGATLIKAKVTSGPDAGQEVVIINRTMDRSFYNIMAKPGDKVILALMTDPSGKTTYHIADYERGSGLIWLAGLFIVLLLLFGRGVGLRAVFVIGTSLVILYYGFVGQVLAGGVNVLLLTFIVAILISAITLFSVSGREPKTWAAFIGTMGGVAAAGRGLRRGVVQFDQHGAVAAGFGHRRSPIRNSAARSSRIWGGPSPGRNVLAAGRKFIAA